MAPGNGIDGEHRRFLAGHNGNILAIVINTDTIEPPGQL